MKKDRQRLQLKIVCEAYTGFILQVAGKQVVTDECSIPTCFTSDGFLRGLFGPTKIYPSSNTECKTKYQLVIRHRHVNTKITEGQIQKQVKKRLTWLQRDLIPTSTKPEDKQMGSPPRECRSPSQGPGEGGCVQPHGISRDPAKICKDRQKIKDVHKYWTKNSVQQRKGQPGL